MVFASLLGLFRSQPEPAGDPFSATTQALHAMLGRCPACFGPLDGHAWATLAEAGDDDDFKQVVKFLPAREWRELSAIQSFDGAKNAIIASAIRCPYGPGVTLAYLDYADLYGGKERGAFNQHSDQQWLEFSEALPELVWHLF